VDATKFNPTEQLLEIPKLESESCSQHRQEERYNCVHADGVYFEAD
jgi:hypothetical protein